MPKGDSDVPEYDVRVLMSAGIGRLCIAICGDTTPLHPDSLEERRSDAKHVIVFQDLVPTLLLVRGSSMAPNATISS